MKRKTYAICVAGYDWECESKIINGFYKHCLINNCNLLIFASAMRKCDIPKYYEITNNVIKGELEIFNLINYELLDGVIVFGSKLYNKKLIYQIEKACEAHNIPAINVNDPNNKLKHNVLLTNTGSMEKVISHLIEEHGVKTINFIGGYPGNNETEERLAAYKKILTKNKIPVEENRIGYGYFWTRAIECVKRFQKDDVMPDAIVCANDSMAIITCEYLKEQGYKVPDDIIVTGFDGISDADVYTPAITTVRPNYFFAGEEAFRLVDALRDGRKIADNLSIDSELVIQESCGCHCTPSSRDAHLQNLLELSKKSIDFNTGIATMNIHFTNSNSSQEMFGSLLSGITVFNFDQFFICINAELEKSQDYFYSEAKKKKYGISDRMISMVSYKHEVPVGTEFNSKELLPNDFLNGDNPIVMVFTPLYLKDKFLGYTAFEPCDHLVNCEMYLVWLMNASNAIGNYYIKRELEDMYMQDSLTGMYNRRGMDRLFEKVLSDAEQKPCEISVICVDIDDLKLINDNYGHEAGDVAIIESAKAIKDALPKDSICVRTGGDEFCVLIHSSRHIDVRKKIEKIYETLENYNSRSGLPYKVMCSCGFETADSSVISGVKEFSIFMKSADKNLYIEKAIHKGR